MAYRRTLFSHGFKISPLKEEKERLSYTYFVRAPRFRAIVFKGGGGRTWVYKKLLHMMEERGLTDDVKEFGGSSAGALFAVLAAMPLKHKERETIIDNLKFHRDILDNSTGSMLYRIITSPLYLISTPLSWIAHGFSFAAEQCLKVTGGFLLALPFKIISGISRFASIITHPECAAGIYNLATKGGIYCGKELQQYVRKSLHDGTKKSLERYLNHIDDPKKQKQAIIALTKMHDLILCIKRNPQTNKINVRLSTHDITFNHFHELSKIKSLGFKDVFLTATRCRETRQGRLKILNYKTEPHKPIHLAVRISMSAPLLYQTVHDRGMEYMDGGCADNFPIKYASHRHYANHFEARYLRGQKGQDLDTLGVRVEYEKDLGILHQPVYVMTGWWEKFISNAQERIYNFICGMDIYTPENKTQHTIKEKYPLRVLQLYDHGVGFTEVDIEEKRKDTILQCEEKRIHTFLETHGAELSHVENYDSLSREKLSDKNTMSLKRQKKFLHFLCNKSIPDEMIFTPHFSEQQAHEHRNDLIHTLTVNLKGSRSLHARESKTMPHVSCKT